MRGSSCDSRRDCLITSLVANLKPVSWFRASRLKTLPSFFVRVMNNQRADRGQREDLATDSALGHASPRSLNHWAGCAKVGHCLPRADWCSSGESLLGSRWVCWVGARVHCTGMALVLIICGRLMGSKCCLDFGTRQCHRFLINSCYFLFCLTLGRYCLGGVVWKREAMISQIENCLKIFGLVGQKSILFLIN